MTAQLIIQVWYSGASYLLYRCGVRALVNRFRSRMADEVIQSWAAQPYEAMQSWAPQQGAQIVPVDKQEFPRIALLDRKLRSSSEGPVQPRFRLHVAKKSPQWVGYNVIERRGGTDGALARLLFSASQPSVRPSWVSEVTWTRMSPSSGSEWLAWADMYMSAVPADWGWRYKVRVRNLVFAKDHAGGGWAGAFGAELVRKGFVIVR